MPKLLVVATVAVEGAELRRQIEGRGAGGPEAVHVVSPALTGSAIKHAMGDVDDAKGEAQERLDASLEELRGGDAKVTGTVGDSDPLLAIEDALQVFPADEILIVTHSDEDAAWLEDDLYERSKAKFEPPLTHVVVGAGSDTERVADVERSGRGVKTPEDEIDVDSSNQAVWTMRDLGGLLVAIVGTIVLVVLAANCENVEEGSGTASDCIARILIAGAVALVNAAHIVGLLLFQSVGYHGGWARLFALMSLVLTPVAIVVSLLVH